MDIILILVGIGISVEVIRKWRNKTLLDLITSFWFSLLGYSIAFKTFNIYELIWCWLSLFLFVLVLDTIDKMRKEKS